MKTLDNNIPQKIESEPIQFIVDARKLQTLKTLGRVTLANIVLSRIPKKGERVILIDDFDRKIEAMFEKVISTTQRGSTIEIFLPK